MQNKMETPKKCHHQTRKPKPDPEKSTALWKGCHELPCLFAPSGKPREGGHYALERLKGLGGGEA